MRISKKDLERQIQYLNQLTGSPLEPYAKEGDKFKPQKGNYHLYQAYGAYGLDRMSSDEHGGVERVFGLGTKKELYAEICAFVRGIEVMK